MIEEILEPFSPFTEYGKRWLKKTPRLIKDEKSFDSHFDHLRKVVRLDRQVIDRIVCHLSRIPAVDDVISQRPQNVGEFARLKRYLYNYEKLKEVIGNLYDFADLSELWQLFARLTSEQESFNLQSERMLKLRNQHNKITGEISKERSKLKQKIEEMLNVKIALDEFTCDRQTGEVLLREGLAEVIRESLEKYHLRIKPTEKILKLEESLKRIEEELSKEEERLLDSLGQAVEESCELLRKSLNTIEQIDLDLSRYRFFHSFSCCIPNLDERISFSKAVFPPILKYCTQNGYQYYPVTFETNKGVTLLYGPNMGGKTSFLRTVGSLVALMHLGYPIPAEKFTCPIFEEIRYISKGENLGLSSFAKEIQSFVKVNSSTRRKLVLMDEFGSNTNPVEGEALALAVMRVFRNCDDFVLLTSHYPRLVREAGQIYACGRLKNVDSDDLHTMIEYVLERDVRQSTFMGILLARKLGLPEEIVREALKEVRTYG